MKIYKYRSFHKWAKLKRITDNSLKIALDEMQKGLFDAYLANGLYKKRIAKPGKGKRGGYRTILAFKNNERAIFLYGFEKNERTNITANEEFVFKKLAKHYLELSIQKIEILIDMGELTEVHTND